MKKSYKTLRVSESTLETINKTAEILGLSPATMTNDLVELCVEIMVLKERKLEEDEKYIKFLQENGCEDRTQEGFVKFLIHADTHMKSEKEKPDSYYLHKALYKIGVGRKSNSRIIADFVELLNRTMRHNIVDA